MASRPTGGQGWCQGCLTQCCITTQGDRECGSPPGNSAPGRPPGIDSNLMCQFSAPQSAALRSGREANAPEPTEGLGETECEA